jgi:hypothetical protein
MMVQDCKVEREQQQQQQQTDIVAKILTSQHWLKRN